MPDYNFDPNKRIYEVESYNDDWNPDDVPIGSLNDMAGSIISQYFAKHSVICEDLLYFNIWSIYFDNIQSCLNRHFLSIGIPEKNVHKYLQSDDPAVIAVALALIRTDSVRIVHKDSRGAKHCVYALRGTFDKIPAAFWDPITAGKHELLISLMRDLHPVTYWRSRRTKLMLMFDLFYKYAETAAGPADYGYKLIPCSNGLYDGRDGVFTLWTDNEAFESKYPGLCMAWRLKVDYNPDAFCDPDLDPLKTVAAYFDLKTPKGQASYRAAVQALQFAVRGYAGSGGNLVLLSYTQDGDNYHAYEGKCSFGHLAEKLFRPEDRNGSYMYGDGSTSLTTGRGMIHADDYYDSDRKLGKRLMDYVCYKPVRIDAGRNADVRVPVMCVKMLGVDGDLELNKIADASVRKHCIALWFAHDFLFAKTKDVGSYMREPGVAECLLKYLCEMPFIGNYDAKDRKILNG